MVKLNALKLFKDGAMEFLKLYAKEIVALCVPILTFTLNNLFKRKTKLQYAVPHTFSFWIQEPLMDGEKVISPTQTANTRSHLIRNAGKETATNVEIIFNWKPQFFNLWPLRRYSEQLQSDNRYILVFDSLSPGEMVNVELLSVNRDLPHLVHVRCDQAIGQEIHMIPQPINSQAMIKTATLLIGLGSAAAIYILILLIQLLVTTP